MKASRKIENILFIFLNNEIRHQDLSERDLSYFLKVSERSIYRYLKVIENFKKDYGFPL